MDKTNEILLSLLTSRVRIKILSIFLPNPDSMYYVRQVTRMTEEEVNAVRRELERLRDIGLLTTEQRANRLYYRVNIDFVYYYDLLRIVTKTQGLGQTLLANKDALGKVTFAALSIPYSKGRKPAANDIDVLIVGKVQVDRLQAIIREREEIEGKEINYTVMTEDEFMFRKSRGDAFIRDVLAQPLTLVIGNEEELYAQ